MTRSRAQLLGPCFKTGRSECREPRGQVPAHARHRARRPTGRATPNMRKQFGAAARHGLRRRAARPRAERAAGAPHPRRRQSHPACNTAAARAAATLPGRVRRRSRRTPRFPNAECTPPPEAATLNGGGELAQFRPFACRQFHVLLNSLFKVLCNFPSRYLFAIGVPLGI